MTVMNSVTKYHQTYHSPLPYDYHKQGSKKLFSSVIPFEMFCESAYCFAVWIRKKKCKMLFSLLNCLYFTPFPLAKESTIYQVPIPLFLPLWRKLFSLTKTSVWQTNFSVTDFFLGQKRLLYDRKLEETCLWDANLFPEGNSQKTVFLLH